jgi:hypothetical protein
MSDDPEWFYPSLNDLPCDNRAVVVLIGLKDGTFYPDIGRYYGKDGWSLQTWPGSTVIGWSHLPSFKDHIEVVDHTDDVSTPSMQGGDNG